MIQSRNPRAHTYNEDYAKEVAEAILSSYVQQFEKASVAKFSEL